VRFVVTWDDILVFPMAGEELEFDTREDARASAVRYAEKAAGVFWVTERDDAGRTVSVEEFDPETGQWSLVEGLQSLRDLPEDP
jgi:hypothetical protein